MVEATDQLGGAWGTIQMNGDVPVEFGCHIWDHDQRALNFLRDYLNIQISSMKPAPRLMKGNWNLPYSWKNAVFVGKKLLQPSRKYARWANLRVINNTFYYPVGGCTDLMSDLLQKLEESTVEVKRNCKVEAIAVEEKVLLRTSEGELNAGQVCLTSVSEISEVQLHDESMDIDATVSAYWHVHMWVRKNTAKPLTYIRVVGDPWLHRVSNLTSQLTALTGETPGYELMLVGLHHPGQDGMDRQAATELLFEQLKSKKFISRDAVLDDFHWNSYENKMIPLAERLKLTEADPSRIQLLGSTNFMYGIGAQAEKWSPVLLG